MINAMRRSPFANPPRVAWHRLRRSISHLAEWLALFVLRTTGRDRVFRGPFRGTVLCAQAYYGGAGAKLLGTYEKELHTVFARLRLDSEGSILVVGGADGYYPVGLAIRYPKHQIVVYEICETAQTILLENAKINGVYDRIVLFGECTAISLYTTIERFRPQLAIFDIEGAEVDVLTNENLSLLAKSWLIVELHDFLVENARTEIIARLPECMKWDLIGSQVRKRSDFPLSIPFPEWLKVKLMNEQRPVQMEWLVSFPIPLGETSK